MTSRGEERHRRHSDEGSSSKIAAGSGGEEGGYVCEVGDKESGAVGAEVCEDEEELNP